MDYEKLYGTLLGGPRGNQIRIFDASVLALVCSGVVGGSTPHFGSWSPPQLVLFNST